MSQRTIRITRGRRLAVAGLVTAGLATGGVVAAEASFASGGPSNGSGGSSGSTSAPKAPAPPAAPSQYDFDGIVSSVSSSSITVHDWFGTSRTYAVSDSTAVHNGRKTSSVSAVTTGTHVHVQGSKSGSTYTAKGIDIMAAHIDGQVTSLSGDTVTVTDRDGFTRTIDLSSSTTFTKDGASSSRSALADGSVVHAEGTVASDHTSLDASTVDIQTKDTAPAGPGAGGPGGAPGAGPGGAPKGTPKGGNGKAPSGAPKAPSGAPKSGAPKAPSGAPKAPTSSTSTSR